MTEMLDKAFEQASRLPEDEQNEFAAFVLEELKTEEKWSDLLSNSQGKLSELAEEARQEYEAGDTEPFRSPSE